jgi:hypothetical protein
MLPSGLGVGVEKGDGRMRQVGVCQAWEAGFLLGLITVIDNGMEVGHPWKNLNLDGGWW